MTLLRLIAVPVFCTLLATDHDLLAGYVFVSASVTDLLDGQLARRMKIISRFGQMMDPVADRLLVGSAVILLSLTDPRLPVWAFALVLARDVLLGIWFALVNRRMRPQVSMLGKASSATLMVALVALLFTSEHQKWPATLLWIGVGMALTALLDYILRYESYVPAGRKDDAAADLSEGL